MAIRKPKHPVTPLPMDPELRADVYKEADRLGRKLITHLLIVVRENTPRAKSHK